MFTGLTHQEVLARQKRYGMNTILTTKKGGPLFIFLKTFWNPLVIILIACAVISFFLGDHTGPIIIITIVLLSSLLDFFNTFKADKAAETLKSRVRVTTTVIRDGKTEEIRVSEVVPGDILSLSAGDIVPADAKVLEAAHCFTNESSLTGESYPVAKDLRMPLYMGSSIASGQVTAEVTETGAKTKYSDIVRAVSTANPETQFDREIAAFSRLVLKVTIVLTVFVFVVNALLKGNILESLLFSVALAVGITPELLPLIITLNLTKGSLAMGHRGVIVKRLSAIQNFGSMDILCTDKTGTLTEDHIALVKYVDSQGRDDDEVLRYAYYNSSFSGAFSNPLDDAVRAFRHISIKGIRKLDEVPFDFLRRRESVVVEQNGKAILVAKGAPEEIFKVCSSCAAPDHTLQEAQATYERLSKDGFRVLAIGMKKVKGKKFTARDEKELTFIGFVGFLDPPKSSVRQTLSHMHDHGIKIKIITGDNDLVTARVAHEIGLLVTGTLRGDQIERLSDEQLVARVDATTIFSRVNPEQKMRVIKSLQAAGHVVGYMGDGINDAPSLRAADVGISVNNATDIAKESADLILMHKSLEDLVEGVLEGRRTFVNTVKYLMMVLSSNFGNVFSMAAASVVLPFLPMLPTQILFNNLVYDTSQMSIPFDTVDEGDLKSPRTLDITALRKFMYVFGPLSSMFDFLTFGALLLVFHLSASGFQTGWFLESLATQIFVVYVIRTRAVPFFKSHPHWLVVFSTVTAVVVGWAVALSSIGRFLSFAPLATPILIAISIIVVVYLALAEVTKAWFFRQVVTPLS